MTKRSQCAYCDNVNPETRDHLPPKSFFPAPRPANLITVPCCEACRTDQSKDDETLRLLLAVHPNAGRHPAMRRLDPTRALGKLQKWRFAAHFLSLKRTNVAYMPSGIVIPTTSIIVETEPLIRFLTRLTRGLHFHHAGQQLPSEWKVFVAVEPMFTAPDTAEVVAKLRREKEINIGDGVFAYKFAILLGHMTTWLFKFYESVELVTFAVAPPDSTKMPAGDWLRSSSL